MWPSTYKLFHLSLSVCQFFGLITFNITKRGTFKSKMLKFYAITLGIVTSSVSVFGLVFYVFLYETFSRMESIFISILLLGIHCVQHSLTIIIVSIRNEDLHRQLLYEITKYDTKFVQMGFTINNNLIIKQQRRIWIYKILLFSLNVYLKYKNDSTKTLNATLLVLSVFYLSIIGVFFITILLINYLIYFRMRCKQLNEELRKILKSSTETNNINLSQRLMNICLLHHNLFKITRKFNKIFVLILLSTTAYSISCLTAGFYLISVSVRRNMILKISDGLPTTFLFIDFVCTFSHACEAIDNEVQIYLPNEKLY